MKYNTFHVVAHMKVQRIRKISTVNITKRPIIHASSTRNRDIHVHTLLQALRRLDLPTFGRPIIAICNIF